MSRLGFLEVFTNDPPAPATGAIMYLKEDAKAYIRFAASFPVDIVPVDISSKAVLVPCRAATTANITLSGLQTIDGVSLVAGNRVLVKDQSNPIENGIWTAHSSAWARASDFASGAGTVESGALIMVTEGTTQDNKLFALATADPITVGSTGLSFVQVTGAAADELLKISSADTTAGYLEDKLVNGTNTTVSKNNAGGNETLQINVSSAAPSGSAGGDLTGTYPNPDIAAGAVGSAEVNAAIKDPVAGTAGLRTLGTGAQQACAGNDSRLSDSRAPTGSAGGSLTGTYPNPTIAAGAVGGTEIAAAIKDPVAGTAGLRTLGTGAQQACAGNDSRLSDSRAPTGSAGGSLAGTYPNPTIAAGAVGGTEIAAAIKDPVAGTAGLRTLGTGAQQACAGNDSRLSDARTPTGAAGGDLGGTYANPQVKRASGDFALTNVVTAVLSADQNNYNVLGTTGLAAYLTPNANPRTITGITDGTEGRIIVIHNSSATNSICLANESASSTATNRVASPTGADVFIPPLGRLMLMYSSAVLGRWVPLVALDTIVDRIQIPAVATDDPTNSNWAINAIATLQADSLNAGLVTAAYDDTTEQGRGFELYIPPRTTKTVFTFICRAQTAPVATRTVGPKLYKRLIADVAGGTAVSTWDSVTMSDFSFGTNTNWQVFQRTVLHTDYTLDIVAGNLYQFELTRINPAAGTELVGNMNLKMIIAEFI